MTANEILVQYARQLSAPMFNYFHENGIFVDNDAHYRCFDHHNSTLRGELVMISQLWIKQVVLPAKAGLSTCRNTY